MKKLELTKLREKSIKELEKQVEKIKLQKALTEAKMAVGKEKNLKAVAGLKRDIAQILTIIKEKEKAEG
ncbi:50S ribosomal protein L29 [Candidatus Woesebacteria bacterium RIFCSPHIGHO2_01_FULL_44_10]|uniref:Large ribosomal subunit protein uL29 n=1 Tax=Candidatus Woesebacteria bacterium RIFCSPLOWO2_01_FULL_44_14 TaxID=1802525 RepID=A0A1F8C1E4_9BACT|nr:MAG: 50S ribosomal protein L29 [Candidatus Woesebacteria bacterium RIFCSPHIGHO2_01_FULL_44_10]OGM54703.1 MAG: 50S ribosomal protein L29 [Candidatus Woesebacteria bacterium RIFCSPHIGHO2_12_FULL_44_11]OGM70174.1 MAG: 50S ribosomal protein L29 [Candidatus Woesebacteria bacterium RIFCSPLOWO2_01_FULL_44_14]